MIPSYLHYCITMALHRAGEYVLDRLAYLILCMPKNWRAESLYRGAVTEGWKADDLCWEGDDAGA